jgi:hypothetical protein
VIWVFDMDGCIVDSRKAVAEAYRQAGLPVMPRSAWGKTAQEWECPPEVRETKKRLYDTCLRKMGRRLHAASLLEITGGSVLTGASMEAVRDVRKFIQVDFPLAGAECDSDLKIEVLRGKAAEGHVMYVDDDREFGMRVLQEVEGVHFMHTMDHEGVYHVHNKRGETQRWTMSEWTAGLAVV